MNECVNKSAAFWRSDCLEELAYDYAENEQMCVFLSGIAALVNGGNVPCKDLLEIAQAAVDGSLNYNNLHGYYRMVVYDKVHSKHLFWGDNSGSQFFFVDWQENLFSDRFLTLVERRSGVLKPCYEAVIQIINDHVFSNETVVAGITKTDPEMFYEYQNGVCAAHSKALQPLSQRKGIQLDQLMEILTQKINDAESGAVCTGGTDSRAVLAHLNERKKKPRLLITGHPDNPDVGVAREIAEVLKLPLTVITPADRDEAWLDKAFQFSDGLYDTVLSYRHFQIQKWTQENGIRFLYGGVGGEFYKNFFCHPFRNRTFRRPVSGEKLFDLLMKNKLQIPAWGGQALAGARKALQQKAREFAANCAETGNVLFGFNRLGFSVLRNKAGMITHAYAGICTRIDPLMNRDVVAAVSKIPPVMLSMHLWQRKEIRKCCPSLGTLPTDQGYSCSMNSVRIFSEQCKKLCSYCKAIWKKIIRKLGFEIGPKVQYWDRDYNEAKNTPEFARGLQICKNLGITREGVDANTIPDKDVGLIIMLGYLFASSGN